MSNAAGSLLARVRGTLGNVKFFTKSIEPLLWEMAEWFRHLTVNQGNAGSNPVLPAIN